MNNDNVPAINKTNETTVTNKEHSVISSTMMCSCPSVFGVWCEIATECALITMNYVSKWPSTNRKLFRLLGLPLKKFTAISIIWNIVFHCCFMIGKIRLGFSRFLGQNKTAFSRQETYRKKVSNHEKSTNLAEGMAVVIYNVTYRIKAVQSSATRCGKDA